MDFLVNLFTGAASGGIFGLLGSIVGVVSKQLQAKAEERRQDKQWQHELALQRLQMERGDRETENEIEITREKGAADARAASYGLNMMGGGETSMWVRDFRGIFRPALTVWLWIMIPVVMLVLWWMLTPFDFAKVVTVDLVLYIMQSLVFAASSATTWWFGDRAMSPPGLKHK